MSKRLLWTLYLLYILPFSFLLAQNKQPNPPELRSYAERETELTAIKNSVQAQYMKDWIEITRGENIALGKTVTASIEPNYRYAPNNLLENLLDGRLSKSENGKLLFTPETFGWSCDGNIARLDEFIEQVTRDAEYCGRKPIVLWKRNRKPWLAMYRELDLPHHWFDCYIQYGKWRIVQFDVLLRGTTRKVWFDE